MPGVARGILIRLNFDKKKFGIKKRKSLFFLAFVSVTLGVLEGFLKKFQSMAFGLAVWQAIVNI